MAIPGSQRKVLLAGATGLVGGHILQALLADQSVFEIHVLSRRPLSISHPKLRVQIVDFSRPTLSRPPEASSCSHRTRLPV